MNEISKPAHSHGELSHGGSCCGGADAKAKPQTAATDKANKAAAGDAGTKPAGSSGCCCS